MFHFLLNLVYASVPTDNHSNLNTDSQGYNPLKNHVCECMQLNLEDPQLFCTYTSMLQSKKTFYEIKCALLLIETESNKLKELVVDEPDHYLFQAQFLEKQNEMLKALEGLTEKEIQLLAKEWPLSDQIKFYNSATNMLICLFKKWDCLFPHSLY